MNIVLDLDHTLLHAVDEKVLTNSKVKEMKKFYQDNYNHFKFTLENDGERLEYKEHMILRDGVHEFLSELHPYFNLYINTKGRYEYACEIAKVLDPEGKYDLLNNIMASFNKQQQHQQKNLEWLFKQSLEFHNRNVPKSVNLKDLLDNTVIFDDSIQWWEDRYKPNLIMSKMFTYKVDSWMIQQKQADTKYQVEESRPNYLRDFNANSKQLPFVLAFLKDKLLSDIYMSDQTNSSQISVSKGIKNTRLDIFKDCGIKLDLYQEQDKGTLMILKGISEQMGAGIDPPDDSSWKEILYPGEHIDIEKSFLFKTKLQDVARQASEDNRVRTVKLEYIFDAYLNLCRPDLTSDYKYSIPQL